MECVIRWKRVNKYDFISRLYFSFTIGPVIPVYLSVCWQYYMFALFGYGLMVSERVTHIYKAVLCGLLLSLLIETMQFILGTGVSEAYGVGMEIGSLRGLLLMLHIKLF